MSFDRTSWQAIGRMGERPSINRQATVVLRSGVPGRERVQQPILRSSPYPDLSLASVSTDCTRTPNVSSTVSGLNGSGEQRMLRMLEEIHGSGEFDIRVAGNSSAARRLFR